MLPSTEGMRGTGCPCTFYLREVLWARPPIFMVTALEQRGSNIFTLAYYAF